MKTTIIVKLLGQSIGYATLHNSISSLWRSSKPFQLMDVENGYFFVKFQSKEDYEKVLTEGPWTVFGLPGYPYNKKILEEIRGMIEKVVKLDFNTDKRLRRRFSRLAIFVNLDKPLILQILINDKPQRVEYKPLSTIYFS
ncbi:hypothetical protein Goklo_029435 [Gossypium klotzschianum]|uniref:DUF4283 domain-containing protein n=1 Tax=Gossypium klotzschianum TaxID=34286 RepID=A0A7J8W3U5_9ROSI|nr:hypothetical protein [Gossypium klotzschianum]